MSVSIFDTVIARETFARTVPTLPDSTVVWHRDNAPTRILRAIAQNEIDRRRISPWVQNALAGTLPPKAY